MPRSDPSDFGVVVLPADVLAPDSDLHRPVVDVRPAQRPQLAETHAGHRREQDQHAQNGPPVPDGLRPAELARAVLLSARRERGHELLIRLGQRCGNDAVELVVVQEPQRLRLSDLRELGHRRRIALDVAPAHGETHHRVEGADVVVDCLRREPGVSQPGDQPFGVALDDLGDEHVAEQGVDVLAEMPGGRFDVALLEVVAAHPCDQRVSHLLHGGRCPVAAALPAVVRQHQLAELRLCLLLRQPLPPTGSACEPELAMRPATVTGAPAGPPAAVLADVEGPGAVLTFVPHDHVESIVNHRCSRSCSAIHASSEERRNRQNFPRRIAGISLRRARCLTV